MVHIQGLPFIPSSRLISADNAGEEVQTFSNIAKSEVKRRVVVLIRNKEAHLLLPQCRHK